MLMMSEMLLNHCHLSTPNSCADITHPIVITYLLMLIVRIALAILRRIHHHLAPMLLILSNQCSATRRCNHLITIKRQHAILTECTQHLPLVARTKALSRILHHGDPILIRNLHNAIRLIRHAIQCHRHDSLRIFSRLLLAVNDCLFQQLRIDIPSIRLRIHQNRFCS